MANEDSTTYYFISDLHIGGDGDLDACDFEGELIAFLRRIAAGPRPAELIIIGDAFGLWELTTVTPDEKMGWIIRHHPALFDQFRETGKHLIITLLPGNHDYDLACVPAYKTLLAEYHIHLETEVHLTRPVAGRKIWVEHGNQHDTFNAFPDFGNRFGLPPGYFVATDTVALSGRSAERGRSPWLLDLQSVYPNEEIPFWIWSNYFYREMTPILRWFLVPFLVLFTFSGFILLGRALEGMGLLPTTIFHARLVENAYLPGRLVDWVVWVNGVVISFAAVLAVPLYFLTRDIKAALQRFGVDTSQKLKLDKEEHYLAAAQTVFEKDPAVVLYLYGHTHIPSMRALENRYVINTGTWLKMLERVPAFFRLLPDVYVPAYRLNFFSIREDGKRIRVRYEVIPKEVRDDRTFLEKLVILGKHRKGYEAIPMETVIE